MSDAFRQRVVRLFQDAVNRPQGRRATYLAEAFAGDATLISGVLSLLAGEDVTHPRSSPAQNGEAPSDTASDEETATFSDTQQSTRTTPHDKDAIPSTVGFSRVASDVESVPRRFGNYELIELVARGGMGIVYKARQLGLNRVVALKMILSGELADEEEVKRFLVEAQAAARLQHPRIVPIHEVGEHHGRHFFSMDFIEGQSLKEAASEGPMPARQAADLVKKIAEAVEYAHQHDIIHRDLKPGNILLDDAGQPHVSDFGLAKSVRADSQLTATGQVLGTPNYMPPEQAQGRSDQVGERSDVYSLGAILYALLTGRPPFQTASIADTLHQVIHQDPASPRQLNAAVDRDLETICLKCLEKGPMRRYDSAAQLAQELDRFLQGLPIQARPVSRIERLRRWQLRNPLVATLSALFVAALLLGITLSTYFAINAKTERDAANQSLVAQRAALRETRRTIDNYVETIYAEELLRDERFRRLLTTLLSDALAHYQRFMREHRHDDDELADLANAVRHVAEINHQIAQTAESLTAYDEAISQFQQLVQRHPDSIEYSDSLATCYSNVGLLYQTLHRSADAAQSFEAALEIGERLLSSHPRNAEIRDLVADVLNNLADLHRSEGNLTQALATIQKVIETAKQFTGGDGGLPADQFNLGTAYLNLGGILDQSGETQAALDAYVEGNRILQRLIETEDEAIEYYSRFGEGLNGVASVYRTLDKLTEARQAYERASRIYRQLDKDNPHIPNHLLMMGVCHNNLGNVDLLTGALAAALSEYQQAEAVFKQLLSKDAEVGQARHHLAASRVNIGYIFGKLGKTTEAAETYQQALSALRQLEQEAPTSVDIQRDLGYVLGGMGVILSQTDQHAEALQWYRQSLQKLQELLGGGPDGDAESFRTEFSAHYAVALARTGAHAQAITFADEAAHSALVPEPLYHAAIAFALASAVLRRDQGVPEETRLQGAERAAARAVEILDRLRQADFFADGERLRDLSSSQDFDSLRDREDFKRLAKFLEERAG